MNNITNNGFLPQIKNNNHQLQHQYSYNPTLKTDESLIQKDVFPDLNKQRPQQNFANYER